MFPLLEDCWSNMHWSEEENLHSDCYQQFLCHGWGGL